MKPNKIIMNSIKVIPAVLLVALSGSSSEGRCMDVLDLVSSGSSPGIFGNVCNGENVPQI